MRWTRRELLRKAAALPALGVTSAVGLGHLSAPVLRQNIGWAEHVPVQWVEPLRPRPGTNVVIWLTGFSGTADALSPYLVELAQTGFVAVTFDHWQHGRRGTETAAELRTRVFSNFRRRMWPIIGQGVLDTSCVIDWIQATFPRAPAVHVGGFSMGGDVAAAAAGHDDRIKSVAAVVATPDWLRPGMRDPSQPSHPLIPPGEPDSYARFFYDRFNPLTHLERYDRAPAITFECAGNDVHVPPDGALRFHEALRERNAKAAANVRVTVHAGYAHDAIQHAPVFWQRSLQWFVTHA